MTPDPVPGHAAGPTTSAQRLVASLRDRKLTIATAESLTAGLISATMADVPGASAVLRGGLSAYTNDVKQDCLGIEPGLIERHGAISPECAEAMAYQARRVFRADVAVAATGVAGPEEQENRPVGTVFVAVATATEVQTARLSLSGNRRAIRHATVEAALILARSVIAPLRDESGGLSSDPAGAG
ncbi:MAG: CinA family protein [Nocardioidaceae bacterium]|nr:CinA family protein [Nocardioidaceae bacterium]